MPGDGLPVGKRAERDGLMDGDRKNQQCAEKIVPGGHGEGVVVPCYALAENDVESERERAAKGDEIAEECGRVAGDSTGSGGENGYAGEGDRHAEGFGPREFFEAEKDGEDEGVDGSHAEDDGRVGDAGIAQADGEAHLIERNTEAAEIREREEVARCAFSLVGVEVDGEGGEACGYGIDEEHEGGGCDYAEGSKSEGLEIAEGVFDGEVVDAPDEHDEGDAGDEDGVGGAAAVGGGYAHGSGERMDMDWIIRGWRWRKENGK